MNLRQLDKKHFGRQGEPEDVVVGNSADSYLTDARGRKYIDFMMGWCVGNLGWGNTEIRAAARKFDGPDYVHPDYLYRPWVQLAEMLARITPGKLAVSYRTTGGTESVEGALQIAMAYTGRGAFVSIEDSYHGNSIAGMSIGASHHRETFKNLLPNCHKIESQGRDAAEEARRCRLHHGADHLQPRRPRPRGRVHPRRSQALHPATAPSSSPTKSPR